MGEFFNLDNPVWRFIGKLCDLIVLSFIWFIFSIPVITIGPSTTALYYVLMRLVKDEEGYLIKDFLRSFKQNFKQSTIIWIILLIIGIILFIDIFWYKNIHSTIGLFMYYLSLILFFIYSMIFLYIFPLVAKFENTSKNLFKFALFMSIKHFSWTVLMFIIAFLIIISSCYFPPLILLLPGLIAFMNSYIFSHIFGIYIT